MSPSVPFSNIIPLAYEIKVEDVMKTLFAEAGPDDTINMLYDCIKKNRTSEIVVIDKKKVVGIIDHEDLMLLQNKTDGNCTVLEKMTPVKECFFHDNTLADIVNHFEHCGSRYPVLNRKTDTLVGTIARCDIVMALLKGAPNSDKENSKQAKVEISSQFFKRIHADACNLQLEYTIQSMNFDKAGEASNQLKKTLKWLNLPKNMIQRASIIAYEAEMNIVIYSDGGQIIFNVNSEQIEMHAKDKGPGIEDIDKAMQSGYSTAPDWVRELGFGAGMGLQNINQYSDYMDLKSTPGKGTRLVTKVKA